MKIKTFMSPKEQEAHLGNHIWSVSRLHKLADELPVMEVPLDCLSIYSTYPKLSLRDIVMHMKAIMNADLSFPILLDEDGEIMDGRHRIMKALFKGDATIKMVRFDENPSPCRITERKEENE